MPNHKACSLFTLPVGMGLKHVLLMTASTSDSYNMFNAPADPEPIATANKDKHAVLKETAVGAMSKPTIQVNKTRDITLGFIRLKNELRSNAKPSLEFLVFKSIWLNLLYFRQLFKSMERRR